MSKRIFNSFLRNLRRDILFNYIEGDRYLTVREIASKFNVSLQTAQKGVHALKAEGLILSKQKSGITVLNKHMHGDTLKKDLVVISNKQDERFHRAFFDGVLDRLVGTGVVAQLIINTEADTNSLQFGEYLESLQCDGIIALSFKNAALPFYHAIHKGVNIISDIIIDELPILPAIQTDNYKHAFQAGKILLQNNYKSFYAFGYYPEANRRYQGFYDAVNLRAKSVNYIHLSDMDALSKADAVFNNFDATTTIFSCDYSANYILASLFLKHDTPIQGYNFLAYDSESDFFHYPGLPPIRCVAPSFYCLGKALADSMILKWQTGAFQQPLQQKI